MTTSKQQNSYPLRMPDDLRRRLEAVADEHKRSLHTEIVMRLERSLADEVGIKEATDAMLIQEIMRRFGDDVKVEITITKVDGQAGRSEG